MEKKSLDEIMRSLYYKKEAFFVDMFGKVKSNQTTLYSDRNNCTSRGHINKWLSINDLLNVACFINQNWQPDWENENEKKYSFSVNGENIAVLQVEYPVSIVYFPSEDLARQAIEILGNEKLLQILK
jgi:hypothetical protein